MSTTPRIYVACLSSYNAGKLHGAWIDADQDAEAIHAEIRAMLAKSTEAPAEEWAIHDSEGFGKLKLSEGEDIATIATVAAFLEEHGEAGAAWLGYHSHDLEWAMRKFEEAYAGTWKSAEEYAENYLEDTGALVALGNLASYFDFDRLARDLELNGDMLFVEDGYQTVYAFNNHV